MTQQEHLVDHCGIDQRHNDTVEHFLRRAEKQLGQQNGKIKGIQPYGHRDFHKFIQHQRWNIHAAGGSAGTDHHAQCHANTDAEEHGTKDSVCGQHQVSEHPVADLEEEGVEYGAGDGGQSEGFAQHQPSNDQHHYIEGEYETGNGNLPQLLRDQRKACGAACNQSRRQQKEFDQQGIEHIAHHHRDG